MAPTISPTSPLLHNRGAVLGQLYSILANENQSARDRIDAAGVYLTYSYEGEDETPPTTPAVQETTNPTGAVVRMGAQRDPGYDQSQGSKGL